MAEAPVARAGGGACAASSRTRSPPGAPPELIDEIYAYRQAASARSRRLGGAGRCRRGLGCRRPARADRGTDARRDRHGRQRRRPAQLGSARRADPGRAARVDRGRGAHALLGADRGVRRDRRKVPRMTPVTIDRILRDRARATPDRVAIDAAGDAWTYAELERRSDELAAGFEQGSRVSTLTRQHRRARRGVLRVREGGRDPPSDLLAARAGRDRLPARRRRARCAARRGRAAPAGRRGTGARARPAVRSSLPGPRARRGRRKRTTVSS